MALFLFSFCLCVFVIVHRAGPVALKLTAQGTIVMFLKLFFKLTTEHTPSLLLQTLLTS
jgi:hypothetical protein